MNKEFELYQDEKGNVYDITTDLEQIIIKDLYKAMKRNNEKQDEIERLNKELEIEKDISDGMLETIEEIREAVETGISEDNYDGCVYDIKNILDEGER